MKSHHITASIGLIGLALLSLAFWGCEGDQGPAGTPGLNPDSPPIITAIVAAPDSIGSGESTVLFVSAYDPNGDAMTYSWTAEYGTLASNNAAVTNWTAPTELGLYQITVTVTDADGEASRNVVVGVNVYVPSVYPSYLGNNTDRCKHCHEAIVDGYTATAHANAWQQLVDDGVETNPYCIQCHTTGYDNIVASDGSVTQVGLDNGGYDQNPIPELRNVQCEACHNPMGPDFTDHSPGARAARRGETCNRCHSQNEEYNLSSHGTAISRAGGIEEFLTEFNRSSCQPCHISEGFIALHDPDYEGAALPEEPWQVTCATCHDVHNKDNDRQLRGLVAFPIIYGGPEFPDGFEISNYGKGQLCGQCHHARRDETNILGQINNGSSRPGPHGSPQADMVAGYGSYEIPGYTYERMSAHQPDVVGDRGNLADMCVSCHMYSIPFGEPGSPRNGHDFLPTVDACNTCHVAMPADFDYNGRRSEIDSLMSALFDLLPNNGAGALLPFDTLNWTRPEREAGYAWYFVTNERSRGVHNFTYASSLLNNSIAYLNAQACSKGRDEQAEN